MISLALSPESLSTRTSPACTRPRNGAYGKPASRVDTTPICRPSASSRYRYHSKSCVRGPSYTETAQGMASEKPATRYSGPAGRVTSRHTQHWNSNTQTERMLISLKVNHRDQYMQSGSPSKVDKLAHTAQYFHSNHHI